MNSQFVLTAAHCKSEDDIIKLRLGIWKLEKLVLGSNISNPTNLPAIQNFDIKPENFVIHEEYIKERNAPRKLVLKNDIALIKLPRKAKFNTLAQPICWKNNNLLNLVNDPPVVVGWGKTNRYSISKTSNGVFSDSQFKLEVKYVKRNFSPTLTNYLRCQL